MNTWSGQIIGSYQIGEEVGQGGMATVYRAYQTQLERWVAIKIMHTAQASGTEFLTRFRREARAVAALRHPNILNIYDYGEERGIAYIVMEYIEGGTLKARLTGQPMEWPDAATLIIPVGHALAYAHSEGVVHRDVKPANVLLARSDWPMLADFGLVKIVGHQRGITRPGVTIGTPAYFSPEQAAGGEVDHRTDVYSLGIVLYQLLTGRLPFEADSPIEAMLRRLHDSPPPPRQLNPHITPQLEAILLRALARDVETRYPTMQDLVNDLSRVPGSTGRVTPPSLATSAPAATARLGTLSPVAGPRLIVAGTGAVLTLPQQGEVLIGRADPQSTRQPDVDLGTHGARQAGVSRHHARLLYYPDGWLLEDLNSTNGTFLNSAPISPGQPVRVSTGDILRCSQLTLIFYEE
ncbi:MAG TPA: FHA domain-containing protein [Chloroflexi bacterium]|nr:FHA domain-containing protein [Chloroflexota bacterium]